MAVKAGDLEMVQQDVKKSIPRLPYYWFGSFQEDVGNYDFAEH